MSKRYGPTVVPTTPPKRSKKSSVDDDGEFLGRQVANYFVPEHKTRRAQLHYGRVTQYDQNYKFWKIEYNDGDQEEVTRDELKVLLQQGKPQKLNQIGIEFVHFLHFRQCVWMQRNPKEALQLTHYKDIPSGPFQSNKLAWKLLCCCTFGNVYRHLDSGTDRLGKAITQKLGLVGKKPSEWDDASIQGAMIFALMQMAGFLEQNIRHAFEKEWRDLPMECCLPSSCKELQKLAGSLKKLHGKYRVLFGNKHQTQGLRWSKYLKEWTPEKVEGVVTKTRAAKTWKMASLALEEGLPGIGAYSSSQALCSVFFGLFKGERGFFVNHEQVVATMNDCTGWGPGPEAALKQIFPGEKTENALVMLTHSVDAAFRQECLDFPYLKDENDNRRALSCVDMEHILCYFHRYLNAKKRMDPQKIDQLYERFQDPEVRKPSIKRLEMSIKSVDDLCRQLSGDADQENK